MYDSCNSVLGWVTWSFLWETLKTGTNFFFQFDTRQFLVSKTLFIPSLSRKESLGSSVKKNLEWFSGNVNSLSIGMSIMLMLQMKARLKDNWLMKEVDLRFVLKNWKFSLQKYLFQIFWLNISFSEKSWYE